MAWGRRIRPPSAALAKSLPDFRAALLDEVAWEEQTQDRCFRGAERYRLWAVIAGVISSVAVALFGDIPNAKYMLAAISLISALSLTIERVFGYRARSGWHCEHRHGLTEILLQVDAGGQIEAVRAARLQLDREMSQRFPQGNDPALPAR